MCKNASLLTSLYEIRGFSDGACMTTVHGNDQRAKQLCSRVLNYSPGKRDINRAA